jgi:hypothetical protein
LCTKLVLFTRLYRDAWSTKLKIHFWWLMTSKCISCWRSGMLCVLDGALCNLDGSEWLIWLWNLCGKWCCQLCCGFVSNMGSRYFFDMTGYKVYVFGEMFVHGIDFCIRHHCIQNLYWEVMCE